MSLKSIFAILSYTTSKLVRFFSETQCIMLFVGGVSNVSGSIVAVHIGVIVGVVVAFVVVFVIFVVVIVVLVMRRSRHRLATTTDLKLSFVNKIHVQTNTKSVQCLCINTKHNKVRITQSQ